MRPLILQGEPPIGTPTVSNSLRPLGNYASQAGHQFESHTEEYRLYGVKQLEIFSRCATRRIRVSLANSLRVEGIANNST